MKSGLDAMPLFLLDDLLSKLIYSNMYLLKNSILLNLVNIKLIHI